MASAVFVVGGVGEARQVRQTAAPAAIEPVKSRRGRGDRLAVVGADLEREAGRAEDGRAVELRVGRDALDLAGDLVDLGGDRVLVVELSVPFSNWTDRSRTRCSIECTSFSAPSAVWTSEMPSWALRCA